MNGRILRMGGGEHDVVQLLLPWYDSGHLDAAETARVTAHLGGCARCQADVAWQRRLHDDLLQTEAQAVVDDASLQDAAEQADRGWAAMRGRFAIEAAPKRITEPARARRVSTLGAWRWLLGAQSAVIAGLAAVMVIVVFPRDGAYRALGNAARAADASIVVVFRPEASEQQVREALRGSDARLVDGPTVTGAYLLSVAPAAHAEAIERLRRDAAVLRVESLNAGSGR